MIDSAFAKTFSYTCSAVGLSATAAITGIISALAGPVAPIVMPIAGCFVLAKWAYDVYQKS